jgi:nucleotide-binding universal stress UspA family protein
MPTPTQMRAIEKYLDADLQSRKAGGVERSTAVARSDQTRNRLAASFDESSLCRQPLKILVAVDHDKHPAIDAAIQLARVLRGTVGIVHVIEMVFATNAEFAFGAGDLVEQQRRDGQSLVRAIARSVPDDIPTVRFLREGGVADGILSVVNKWHPDLVIMGTHRRGALGHFFLGSASDAVVRAVECPVLLVTDTDGPVTAAARAHTDVAKACQTAQQA